jgi:hypothetical protein
VSGGAGDDIMDAFNYPASSNVVACGPANDRAYTDGTDPIPTSGTAVLSNQRPSGDSLP